MVSSVTPAGTHTGQVDGSGLVHWDVKKAEKEKKVTYQTTDLSRRRPYYQDLEENWKKTGGKSQQCQKSSDRKTTEEHVRP